MTGHSSGKWLNRESDIVNYTVKIMPKIYKSE